VLNRRGKFSAKILLHYTDIVIFMLGHFIVTHPVCDSSDAVLSSLSLSPASVPCPTGCVCVSQPFVWHYCTIKYICTFRYWVLLLFGLFV